MEIKKKDREYIREKFANLNEKDDLVALLNDAKKIILGDECKPIELKAITYYANPKTCKKRYSQFAIKKKSGGERIINAPVSGLKSILRSLNYIFQCLFEPNIAANGFVLNKSIVDNAEKHINNNNVYNSSGALIFYF